MSDDRTVPTAAPADRPSFTILSNGTKISAEYQVQAVVVTRSVNRIATADIVVLDGDPSAETFPASDGGEFVPGAEIEVQAGYHGQEETIFKGVVTRHGVKSQQKKGSVLQVECRDKAMALTIGRKSAYFYDQTDADVIEQLAGDAGLDTDIEATDVTHGQLVQFASTDWDFILMRAEANGKLVLTDDGTLTVKKPDGSAAAALSLRFGGNLLEFEAYMEARTQYAAVKGTAWNAADQAMVEVEAAAPSAVSPGDVDSDTLAGVAGVDAVTLAHGGALTDQELQAWADAERTRSAFAKVRGRARTQGVAAIKLADVIELAGVGARFNGSALVAGIRHEISTKNWETDISFGLPPESFGGGTHDAAQPGAAGLLPPAGGLQVGLVTALEGDPDGEERIQVHIPMIDPAGDGTWARLATLDAGADRCAIFRPEIGDEVVIGFLNRDPRHPVVLGQLHSSAHASPIAASDDNHEKGFVTRSGIELKFDDDKKVVVIATPNGNTVTISDDAGGIVLEDENGNTITMDSSGITLDSASDISLKATGDVKVEGSNVEATAQAQFKAEGSAGAEVSSSASTTIKGSMVQIN